MYGLLLDSIQKFLREKYGERYWANIRRRAKLKNHWFVTHEVYNDSVMRDLVEAAAAELGEDCDTVMMMFGEYFAQNIGRYGYARLLRVLGRDLRDFLNGLDDLHEYLRFSYPKMRPPSFICENETPEGMLLHYTTKRKGYLCYVIGQLKTVGKIYGKDLNISVLEQEENEGECHFTLDLEFDNSEMLRPRRPSSFGMNFTVSDERFLGIFPFCLVFGQDLVITRVGQKLQEVLPHLTGKKLSETFSLRKPQFGKLNFKTIRMHTNCMFELISNDRVSRSQHSHRDHSPGMEYSTPPPPLKLKGQMMMMVELDCVVFLGSPAMDSPEDLYESGIFINDISMHDSSRDFILAGSQQNPELNLALDQEKIRSAQLEESVQRTDQLLYQMIPKPIADQLRNGETPLNTCREFDSVSLLFTDIVSFTPMCSRLRPMEVVCVLNAMYVAYDNLCEKHHVYKVETIGDAYMVISGAPVYTLHHAEYITDFAISAIEATSKINDPSTNESLKIRVGIHSGTVVAGVVGASILRYDVFGDTVNVAARMEATGQPMKIHISEHTAELLQKTDFIVKERGRVEVKGKGLMTTYWVTGKKTSSGETMLNPFQRLKQDSPSTSGSPCPSRPSSPTQFTTKGSPATLQIPTPRTSRAVSPKPDEWPQADRRLSRPEPERPRPRSSTLPTIDVNTAQVINGLMESRHGSLPGPNLGCPFSIQDGNISVSASPATPRNRVGSNDTASDFLSRHNSLVSEFNLLRIRESVCLPLPPISETDPSQLALFAAFADDNARQARRLADWAAELARTAVRTREAREESAEGDPFPTEGSSVDPHAPPQQNQPSHPPPEQQSSQPKTEVPEQPKDTALSSRGAADTSVATTSSSKSNCLVM